VLQRSLIDALGPHIDIRLGTTIETVVQGAHGVRVTFSNGRHETFDLVVAADGIHSQIRDKVFGSGYLKSYGWTVWAFWAPIGFSAPPGVVEIAGAGRLYFVYPLADRAVVMLAAAEAFERSEPVEHRLDSLRERFRSFHPSVIEMIDAVTDPTDVLIDDLGFVTMSEWYRGRVVLLGDAQHAISPLTGMGASMALEDAFVLAAELKQAVHRDAIPDALARYALRRGRRLKEFRRASGFVERWLMVRSPILSACRNTLVRLLPTAYFTRPLEKILKDEI
jgi:2-polyprenyl-6-methoxyphenol hydroxylase-like FAD-dependent oxidoreductase